MTYQFKAVHMTTDFSLHVAAAIAGGSGTGKTYSALLLARGLAKGGPIAVIDTENKRALHYRNDFPEMQHYNFGPDQNGEMVGFPPERWIAILDQIEATDAKALVIDSFSHAWEGINGVLELQAQAVQRMAGNDDKKAARVGQLAWAEVKPRYRRLLERIVQSRLHTVICMRAKPVMQEGYGNNAKNARPTKLRRDDLPWDIAADKDLVFEMTVSMLMTPEHPGQPVLLKCPDHFAGIFAGNGRVSTDMGAAMVKWADEGGTDGQTKELLDAAEEAARGGKDSLQAFYKKQSIKDRRVIQTRLDRLRAVAIQADKDAEDDNLFPGEEDSRPSDEEMKAAEEAAMAARSIDDRAVVEPGNAPLGLK